MNGLGTAVRFKDRSAVDMLATLDEDHGVDERHHLFFGGVGELRIRLHA